MFFTEVMVKGAEIAKLQIACNFLKKGSFKEYQLTITNTALNH